MKVCPRCNSPIPDSLQSCETCGFLLKDKAETITYTTPSESLADDSLQFSPGQRFGRRYRIIEEIGSGGMGRVYKAEDTDLNITVALKMIRPVYSSNLHFIQRFKEETLLARSVSHENVIRIHDLGEVGDIKFISMEYVKGHDLKDLIHISGSLSADTTLAIAKQICRGLKAAHQKKVAHLDLKPRNIMLDNDGHAYIMDFGVSRSLEARTIDQDKKVIGTPPYISPEQAMGGEIDRRSDIYSLGIILYEMLTGKRPFEADTLGDYVRKHIEEIPTPPTKYKSDIPPTLEKIVLKCLQKSPDNRYQSCDEILNDLESIDLDIKSVKFKKPLNIFKKPQFYLAFLLALSISIYFIFFSGNRNDNAVPDMTQMTLSVLPFKNNSRENSLDHYREDFQEMIITDLEQSKYLRIIPSIRFDALLAKTHHNPDEELTKDVLDEIAQKESILYYVQGNYSKFGDILRFSIKIVKPFNYETLSSRFIQVEEGQEGALLELIDDLTIWIKTNLGFKRYEIINDYDERIKSFTSSEQALQLYYKGKRSYVEGKFEESNKFLNEAVKLDPDFAMAYRNISINYAYLQDLAKALEYGQKALDLANEGHGSLRDRLLIKGYAHYLLEGSTEKAVSAYEEVLKIYPYDEEAHSGLGAIYRNLGERDLAERHFLMAQLYIPDIAHSNLVWIYMQKGQYSKATDLLETNKDIINPKVYYTSLTKAYFCQGEVDLALKYALKVKEIFPEDYENMELLGNIYQIKGDVEEARQYYLALMKEHSYGVSSLEWQLYVMIQQGKLSDSEAFILEHLDNFRKQKQASREMDFLFLLSYVQYQKHAYQESLRTLDGLFQKLEPLEDYQAVWYSIMGRYLAGLGSAGLGDVEKAENDAEIMKGLIDKIRAQSQYLQYYYHLKGTIALESDDYARATDNFNEGYSSLPSQSGPYDEHALFLDSLGRASYLSGKPDQAMEYFEDIQKLTTGRLTWGNLYVLSDFWLGKIAREEGNAKDALKYFQRFLELWENADPDLPEISEAKKFIDTLQQQ
jgi:serine/threonine protein kinase/Flp pilus assembly protein TadD